MLPTITIIGGADSGKSTLIGTLLLETKSIPKNLIQKVKDLCKKENLVFEPAFLVDYLREEAVSQSTQERALAELKIGKERILIIDTPGQMMLSKKMISGLSEASIVIILLDMTDDDIKKCRYYLKLASLLGFSEIIVAVNKLDLFDYKKEEYDKFLKKIGMKKGNFYVAPISALKNQNLIKKSKSLTWHKGDDLLKTLRKILKIKKEKEETKFLMPVQSVFKMGQEKVALGFVLSGKINIGEEIEIFNGKENERVNPHTKGPNLGNFGVGVKIKKLYHHYKEVNKIFAGENVGVVFGSIKQPIKRGYILHNFFKKYFLNKVDAGIYVLEPFSLNNLDIYTLRFLKEVYKIEKLKIKKRFSFQLAQLNDSSDKLSINEFLNVQMVLDKKLLRAKNITAKRFIIENKEKGVVAIGIIK